jgi:hypothetical protein
MSSSRASRPYFATLAAALVLLTAALALPVLAAPTARATSAAAADPDEGTARYIEELDALGIDPDRITPADRDRLMAARAARRGNAPSIVIPLGNAASTIEYLTADTYAWQYYPDENNGPDSNIFVGRYYGAYLNSYLAGFYCPDGTVTGADLWVNVSANYLVGTDSLTVRRVASSWYEDSLTWNNRPGFAGTGDSTPVTTSASGYTALTADHLVTEICNDGYSNYGLAIYQGNTSEIGYIAVPSVESGSATSYLEIYGEPAPANDTCSSPTYLSVPGTVSGSTVGAYDDYYGSCQTYDGPEVVYRFSGTAGYVYLITLDGYAYDTVLYVRRGDCWSGTEVACNDDYSGNDSAITFVAPATTNYYVFADGYGGGSGSFTLSIDRCTGCWIGGTCYTNGTPNPSNPCQWCDTEESRTAWSDRNGAACEDGQYCSVDDYCSNGECLGGAARNCADGYECTADSCNEAANRCDHAPNHSLCQDENVCTDDLCEVGAGCVHTNNTDPCDDGLYCNGADTCYGGLCSSHTGDPCTPPLECNENLDDCLGPDDDDDSGGDDSGDDDSGDDDTGTDDDSDDDSGSDDDSDDDAGDDDTGGDDTAGGSGGGSDSGCGGCGPVTG